MDMASLQAFVTVAELGSFTLAAEHLHLTQPAVSKRVAGLEDELHSKLFDRIGRQVSLTEAGQALLPRARSILLETEDARRVLTRLGGDVAGRLSMATSHHIGLHRLPPYLKRFTSEYPRVELDMHFMDSETACQLVEHGELELAVVTLPLKPPGTLACTLVWHDPLAFVVANDHPLAQQQTIQPRDLIQHAAILPATGTYTRALLEQALGTLTHELNVSLATNYLETIKMMVSIGLGWSVLPATMIDESLVQINVQGIKLERQLGVVRHVNRTLSVAGERFIEMLDGEV
jgi:DNA-binding transcriptional LysR family regulator